MHERRRAPRREVDRGGGIPAERRCRFRNPTEEHAFLERTPQRLESTVSFVRRALVLGVLGTQLDELREIAERELANVYATS